MFRLFHSLYMCRVVLLRLQCLYRIYSVKSAAPMEPRSHSTHMCVSIRPVALSSIHTVYAVYIYAVHIEMDIEAVLDI